MQGMQVAAEPLSAPPYATECAMTLDGREGTKFQNENVYYMYCLDYIQSVKSILLHKPYLISTPPIFAGWTLLSLLDKTKHSPLTDNAPDRRTGSETRVRYLPIVSIRESQ